MNDTYSLTNLFITKKVKIIISDNDIITINLKTIREVFQDGRWGSFYNFVTSPVENFAKNLRVDIKTSWELITCILYEFGQYKEVRSVYDLILEQLPLLIDNLQIDLFNKRIYVDNVTINDEIWDYILYIVRLSYGERLEKPREFSSEDERQFYLAQKAAEEKIRKIKAQANAGEGDSSGIMKSMLSIIYSFPSLTIDYLFDQTLAQIQWLQKYAAGAVSYEVNAKAFAAGNMKKNSKLDFFIK